MIRVLILAAVAFAAVVCALMVLWWIIPAAVLVVLVLVTTCSATECYSSDLQQINVTLKVLFRVPAKEVVRLYRDYEGDPFKNLVAPRVIEGLKETVAELSAERLVKEREHVKEKALQRAHEKVGEIIEIVDVVIANVDLSDQLEHAIEQKLVHNCVFHGVTIARRARRRKAFTKA